MRFQPFSLCVLVTVSPLVSFSEDRSPETETLQPGVTLTKIASHPDIATPTGVDVDDRGNVWAVACHTHMPPEDYAGPKFDEILVFDEKGNRRVFYDKTFHTMDLELGEDGWVYLAERDRILRIKDSDGDGKADVEENLANLTTKADYPHNGLSAFAWHPDGQLYFGLGENFAKPWVLKSSDGNEFTGRGEGGIFRCQPDGSKMNRVARGMWNPFGMVIRQDREIFAVENDPGERPPCRLLHIVEGANFGYQRAYGREAYHPFVGWNGELRGTLPMVHPIGDGPCGIADLGNGLLVLSWSDHRIDFMPLQQKGASFDSERIQLVTGSRYFRPVCIAPDARSENEKVRSWYLTDWVDGRYQVHGYGRLWKLSINLDEAKSWVGDLELEAPAPELLQAEQLRNGEGSKERDELFQLAESEDPYLASAAIGAIAPLAASWEITDFPNWPESERITTVLAMRPVAGIGGRWIPTLLKDASPEVKFQALRWIADDVMVDFLPQVEELLNQADLEFSLFESAMAARNTLRGTPEVGVRDIEMLLSKVTDPNASPRIRTFALRLLPDLTRSKPKSPPEKKLDVETLRTLLAIGDEALSMEAVRSLGSNPTLGRELLGGVAADENALPALRAEAIAGLATVADSEEDLLVSLAAHADPGVRGEALRSLRSVKLKDESILALEQVAEKYPDAIIPVLAVFDLSTLAAERPPLTDSEAWLARLDAVEEPVDLENGRRIFFHKKVGLCANCHRFEGRGNAVGPDLTRISLRGEGSAFLESILEPNREIAPEYLPRLITLRNGEAHTGIRLRSSTNEVIRDVSGRSRSFKRDDIESMQELQVSFMPAGLPYGMTDRELRDLLAFLENGME